MLAKRFLLVALSTCLPATVVTTLTVARVPRIVTARNVEEMAMPHCQIYPSPN